MTGPTFSSSQDVVARVRSEFAAAEIEAEVHLGRHMLAHRKDARLGQIVILPAEASFPGRRFGGKDQRFTVSQVYAVHVVAKAPQNADRAQQYGDDLRFAEALRNVFLAVAWRVLPIAPDTEITQVLTESGENTFGVELILSMRLALDAPDETYSPNLAPDETLFDTSCAARMPSGELVECCAAEPPVP